MKLASTVMRIPTAERVGRSHGDVNLPADPISAARRMSSSLSSLSLPSASSTILPTESDVTGVGRTARFVSSEVMASRSAEVTSLGSQLAESAKRAEERDRTSTWASLKSLVSSVWDELSGYSGENRAKRDAELPITNDPSHIQRCQEATQFLHSRNPNENPFKGMSGEQLELIAHDSEGPYTLNEREAALREHHRQEQVWRKRVCAAALEEYAATGKTVGFLKEILRYVDALSPIARASFPEDYTQELTAKINRAINAPPTEVGIQIGSHDGVLKAILESLALARDWSRS